MTGFPGISTLTKQMPSSEPAGLKVMVEIIPECKPIPV
jgi:hypothetical protein